MTATGPRVGGFSVVANLAGPVLLLMMPFLASGEWTWGLGWFYTGSTSVFAVLSRAIAIRLHPGFAENAPRLTPREKPKTRTSGWRRLSRFGQN